MQVPVCQQGADKYQQGRHSKRCPGEPNRRRGLGEKGEQVGHQGRTYKRCGAHQGGKGTLQFALLVFNTADFGVLHFLCIKAAEFHCQMTDWRKLIQALEPCPDVVNATPE